MMDFIDFKATVASDNEVGSEDEFSDINSLKSFINKNAAKSIDETSAEDLMKVCMK